MSAVSAKKTLSTSPAKYLNILGHLSLDTIWRMSCPIYRASGRMFLLFRVLADSNNFGVKSSKAVDTRQWCTGRVGKCSFELWARCEASCLARSPSRVSSLHGGKNHQPPSSSIRGDKIGCARPR